MKFLEKPSYKAGKKLNNWNFLYLAEIIECSYKLLINSV